MDMWSLGSDARRSAVKVARCMAEMVSGRDVKLLLYQLLLDIQCTYVLVH